MKALCQRIQTEGKVSGSILDLSSFFNAKIDQSLMEEIGKDFAQKFQDLSFDLYVTVESSGIAPALCASIASNKPLVIIKKGYKSAPHGLSSVPCYSYTKEQTFHLTVNPEFLMGKRIVLIDDFLADGNVFDASSQLITNCNGTLVGFGVCVAKTFQKGYQKIQELSVPVYCQAKINSLSPLIIDNKC